ncbi:MAG: SDR family NAD(P)-dependent oxidoreductase [Clostridia bacterium]|nr:SDR family NAD(P)-dependent oxidoreductase [Clostridia bacterium]
MEKLFDLKRVGKDDVPAKSQYLLNNISKRDIAIVGLSGRIGLAENVNEFWEYVRTGKDFVRSLPEDRKRDTEVYINALKRSGMSVGEFQYFEAGFMDRIDDFDCSMFNLSPKEADLTDPNQRLLLQTIWEGIEDAGYGGKKLAGSRTGVYIGYSSDFGEEYKRYYRMVAGSNEEVAVIGNIRSIIGSRISYILDWKGPSVMVDTACSSFLVAVHLACQAIRNGECDMAVAGGVKLLIVAAQEIGGTSNLGILSAAGRAKTFDDSSDGTGAGEGVGAVILKPLSKAVEDRDHIYAVIKGSAVNQDGSSIGITAPNMAAQEDVINRAWKDANVEPETISYIETHGTATKLGDPIEIAGIKRAFENYTDKKQFCAVASVKSNVGHLDHAAGIASLLKTVMALKHGELPPSIHFRRPNHKIPFEDSPVYVNDRLRKWESSGLPRRCGISGFGLSGTNCHLVLEEYIKVQDSEADKGSNARGPQVITMSAKNKEALDKLIKRYNDFLGQCAMESFEDICHTANTGRGHYGFRLAVIANTLEELRGKIKVLAAKGAGNTGEEEGVFFGEHKIAAPTKQVRIDGEITDDEKKQLSGLADQITTMLLSNRNSAERENILGRLSGLYIKGADVEWEKLYPSSRHKKLSIPSYPFLRERRWIEPAPVNRAAFKSLDYHDWLYLPSWKRAMSLSYDSKKHNKNEWWLIFADKNAFSTKVLEYLKKEGMNTITVSKAEGYAKTGNESFTVNPSNKEDYTALIHELFKLGKKIKTIMHLWNVTDERINSSRIEFSEKCQTEGFYSLLYLAQALGAQELDECVRIAAITNNMQAISNEGSLHPEKSTIIGPCKVIPKEYGKISCQSIDVILPETGSASETKLIDMILAEITSDVPEFTVALRGTQRWLPIFERLRLEDCDNACLAREGAVYLITGGMGGLGLAIARYMAGKAKVKLVLTRRSAFPEKGEWNEWLSSHDEQDKTSKKIRQLMELEEMGSEVLVLNADTADTEQMKRVLLKTRERFGQITGVIHAAGIADNRLISEKSAEAAEKVLAPKVRGTLVMDELFKDSEMEYLVLFSSSSAVLGNAGFVDYCAANTFLDAYAHYRSYMPGTHTVAINWDEWSEVGMAAENNTRDLVKNKITVQEGLKLLDRIVSTKAAAQVVVSSGDFTGMLEDIRDFLQASLKEGNDLPQGGERANNRPNLATQYEAPCTETEKCIAQIWQELLGIYPIGINDDFFDLGGHSLLATTLISKLAKEFHRSISMQSIFERTTVAKLAEMFDMDAQDPDGRKEQYEEGSI